MGCGSLQAKAEGQVRAVPDPHAGGHTDRLSLRHMGEPVPRIHRGICCAMVASLPHGLSGLHTSQRMEEAGSVAG